MHKTTCTFATFHSFVLYVVVFLFHLSFDVVLSDQFSVSSLCSPPLFVFCVPNKLNSFILCGHPTKPYCFCVVALVCLRSSAVVVHTQHISCWQSDIAAHWLHPKKDRSHRRRLPRPLWHWMHIFPTPHMISSLCCMLNAKWKNLQDVTLLLREFCDFCKGSSTAALPEYTELKWVTK